VRRLEPIFRRAILFDIFRYRRHTARPEEVCGWNRGGPALGFSIRPGASSIPARVYWHCSRATAVVFVTRDFVTREENSRGRWLLTRSPSPTSHQSPASSPTANSCKRPFAAAMLAPRRPSRAQRPRAQSCEVFSFGQTRFAHRTWNHANKEVSSWPILCKAHTRAYAGQASKASARI